MRPIVIFLALAAGGLFGILGVNVGHSLASQTPAAQSATKTPACVRIKHIAEGGAIEYWCEARK